MPLSSLGFVLGFLPLAILLHILLTKTKHVFPAHAGLIGFSFIFAGWRTPADAELIVLSILSNFFIGWLIHRNLSTQETRRKSLLVLGVVLNLSVLGYFKYSTFLFDNITAAMQTAYPLAAAWLPLGISFLTFQQIAYLVDVYRREVKTFNFMEYCLFCSFFPKLSAGPIVRYGEFVPQIPGMTRPLSVGILAEGATLFTIGLFKKLVMADTLAAYADPIFNAASSGSRLGMIEAWGGVLAYSFQLYFDFSGYTDMALGIGRMFGITLPQNFTSPYKADNIIEFWTRWHMTLSRFLRDYLYIPLGGNKKGPSRQQVNVMVTMVLCGLWHGANWTFVIWGALHGMYLVINHGWRRLQVPCPQVIGWLLTFSAVTLAWVWFRSDTIQTAASLTASLFGLNGLWAGGIRDAFHYLETPALQFQWFAQFFSVDELRVTLSIDKWTIYPIDVLLSEPALHFFWLVVSGVIVFRLPNTREWMDGTAQRSPDLFTTRRAVFIGALLFLVLFASMKSHPGGFIYEEF
jgi:D-alanyl-lipoteichoic acid acyltransferase DltB (MBOAT superfamily)